MPATKSSTKPDIAQLGHPVLKQQAAQVKEILSSECQGLIHDMMAAVEQAGGVGIAAPQLYQSLRLFIICSKPNARYPNAPLMPPTAMINPEIVQASVEMEKGWEGCLSVPELRGLVPRHKEISVRYYDQTGVLQSRVLTDFAARIFQHELDHLNGLTFVERVESKDDLMSESQWYEQVAPNAFDYTKQQGSHSTSQGR